MEKQQFKEILKENAEKIGIVLEEMQLEQFFLYKELLLDWNTKINLTAITDDLEIIIKHFIDSLTVWKYIENKQSVIDIGTGAGFPGIPLQITNKGNQIMLLDSLNKRIKVLEDISEKLELKNVSFLHGRAEEIFQNKNYREKYDVAVSRAVASLNVLVELMLPAVKVGGICICMKGNNVKEELKNAQEAIKELGGKIIKNEKIILPILNLERNILVIQKEKETFKKYPRKSGTPQKQPL